MVWEWFLRDELPDHLEIEETDAAIQGTYDDELLAHPPDGPKRKTTNKQTESFAQDDQETNDEQAGGSDELWRTGKWASKWERSSFRRLS